MNGLHGARLYCILSLLWLSSGSTFPNSRTNGQYTYYCNPIFELGWLIRAVESNDNCTTINWVNLFEQRTQRTTLLIFSGSKFEIKVELNWYHFQRTSMLTWNCASLILSQNFPNASGFITDWYKKSLLWNKSFHYNVLNIQK